MAGVVLEGDLRHIAVQLFRARRLVGSYIWRFNREKNDSIELECASPRAYSHSKCLTASCDRNGRPTLL